MARLHPDLQPFEPNEADPFDRAKAAHLLGRSGFGGTEDEISRVLYLGPGRAVDELMDFPDAPAAEQSRTDLPDLSSLAGVPLTFAKRDEAMRAAADPDARRDLGRSWRQAHEKADLEVAEWWLKRMAYGPYPLQEKLTLFWHGHFTTSAADARAANLIWAQNETLRTFAAGNFAAFTLAIARDPAMIDYLNNQQNTKYAPNENFARELMELFTLGLDQYTQKDIQEIARCFTGWHNDGDEYVFRESQHDDGMKRVFGSRPYDLNGDDVIKVLMMHPANAPYIAGKLFRFFAYEEPSDDLIKSLGAFFAENNHELRPLLRLLFNSRAFYSSYAVGTQIKSPIQLVIGTQRMLGVESAENRDFRRLRGNLKAMGQIPLMPPNVKGWPGGRRWINTSTLFARYNTAVKIASDLSAIELAPPKFSEPGPIVDRWLDKLIQRPVPAARKKVLIDAVGSPPNGYGVFKLVQLIVSMPEYQLC